MIKFKIVGPFLIVLFMIFDLSRAYNLREIGVIDRRENETFYGLTTGDIVSLKDDQITFYNHRFEPIYELSVDPQNEVIISENGRFYAIVEPGDSSAASCFTVYDNRRQSLWGSMIGDGGEYYLSPNGDCLAIVTGRRGYYERRLVWYHKDHRPQSYDILGFESILFAADGRRILIDAGLKGVYLFDINIGLINKLGPKTDLCFGLSSEFIGTHRAGLIEIYQDSSLVWSYEAHKIVASGFHLCEDANRFVITFKNSIQSIDMESDRLIWQEYINIKGGSVTGVVVSSDRRFIACGVDFNRGSLVEKDRRHTQGFLYLFDFEGRGTEKMEFRYDSYAKDMPQVHFQNNNRIIAVETVEKIHFVEIY